MSSYLLPTSTCIEYDPHDFYHLYTPFPFENALFFSYKFLIEKFSEILILKHFRIMINNIVNLQDILWPLSIGQIHRIGLVFYYTILWFYYFKFIFHDMENLSNSNISGANMVSFRDPTNHLANRKMSVQTVSRAGNIVSISGKFWNFCIGYQIIDFSYYIFILFWVK